MADIINNYKNEIDIFIHKYYSDDLVAVAEDWFPVNHKSEDASSYINEHDSVKLLNAEYKHAINIATENDYLYFTAGMLCNIELCKVVNNQKQKSCIPQWLYLNCLVIISDPTMTFIVKSGVLNGSTKNKKIGYAVDSNLVPYIKKNSLEEEATRFLEEYCPEALIVPMPVPIMEIISRKMGLGVRLGGVLTEKHKVFGQICFSDIEVRQVCFKTGDEIKRPAPRGTIIVDIRTFNRSEGCVNNTLAHEAFHWYRHRVYGTIREMLHGEKYIACRRKKMVKQKNGNAVFKPNWTDEERIEWQANSIAPRILMPLEPFKIKVKEYYTLYGYNKLTNEIDKENALKDIITELSRFFQVSKQSAKIRMIDLGYTEANAVFNYDDYYKNRSDITTEISQADAFTEYRNNEEFRRVINDGKFRYVDNQFIINHEQYVQSDGFGKFILTDYAKANIAECALRFTRQNEYHDVEIKKPSGVAFRMDSKDKKLTAHFNDDASDSIIDNANALHKLQKTFESTYESHIAINQTFSQKAKTLMEHKKWNSLIFKEKTLLDDSMYSRIISNERTPSFRTAMAICIGLGVDVLTARQMLEGAGFTFSPSKEHQAYSYILSALHGKSIDECNAFLESISVKPLGNREKKN